MRRALLGIAIVATAATLTACKSSTSRQQPAAPASSAVVTTASVPASSTTAAAPSTSAASNTFTMPNEVGKILQTAQDDIQRVSGDPVFFSHSTDASGAGRHQILDRDWKVCSQQPAAGTTANLDTYITFAVVKTDESCP